MNYSLVSGWYYSRHARFHSGPWRHRSSTGPLSGISVFAQGVYLQVSIFLHLTLNCTDCWNSVIFLSEYFCSLILRDKTSHQFLLFCLLPQVAQKWHPLHMQLCASFFSLHSPEKYHIFEHNCNTFSSEVAQFLTGKKIPSYITDLPSEVLAT